MDSILSFNSFSSFKLTFYLSFVTIQNNSLSSINSGFFNGIENVNYISFISYSVVFFSICLFWSQLFDISSIWCFFKSFSSFNSFPPHHPLFSFTLLKTLVPTNLLLFPLHSSLITPISMLSILFRSWILFFHSFLILFQQQLSDWSSLWYFCW